jgi:hypothetical protein
MMEAPVEVLRGVARGATLLLACLTACGGNDEAGGGDDAGGSNARSYQIATPEIAPDGRTIYASRMTTDTFYALVEATRSAPDAAFGSLP